MADQKVCCGNSHPRALRAKRDSAILAVFIGCSLRRAELVALKAQDFQIGEEPWVIADLIGKGEHIHTVPVPVWVTGAVDRSVV